MPRQVMGGQWTECQSVASPFQGAFSRGDQARAAMLARIGVMRALNRHVERVFNPDLKMPHSGKRKLKRDQ
jgi:hypothetical protein